MNENEILIRKDIPCLDYINMYELGHINNVLKENPNVRSNPTELCEKYFSLL